MKQAFANAESGGCTCPPGLPCVCGARRDYRLVFRGARKASSEEVGRNPRAASARLRAIERTASGEPGRHDATRHSAGPPGVAAQRHGCGAPSDPRAALDPQPPLRVVEPRSGARRAARRRRVPETLAVCVLVASLLAVVVGHAVLADRPVRLSTAQSAAGAEQAVHLQRVLAVAGLEAPSRIVAQAEQQLHMTQPAQVTQLPSVPLGTPLAPPKITPTRSRRRRRRAPARPGRPGR